MKRACFRGLLAVVLTGILILPTACAEPEGIPSATSTVQPNPWLDLLRVIPASGNTTSVTYVQNYAMLAARQQQFPAVAAVPDGMRVMQNNRFWNVLRYNADEWQRNMGFVMADMDQEAFASRIPPVDQYQVLVGRFDRAKIEAALKSDPINDDLQVVTYSGVPYFSAADDGMTLGKRSNLRPLGQGLRLSLIDNQMFYTNFTRTMQEMIDAHQDRIQSLADLETYQLLTDGLVRLDAFAGILSSESQAQSRMKEFYKDIINDPGEGPGSLIRQTMAKQLQREVFLKPYQAFAVGEGLDENGYYMAVVLLNADQQTANDNAALLEKQIKQSKVGEDQPWTGIIDSMKITSAGRLTLARLYGRAAFYWKAFDNLTGGYEPLLMYKDSGM
jgi:hypothetical protein